MVIDKTQIPRIVYLSFVNFTQWEMKKDNAKDDKTEKRGKTPKEFEIKYIEIETLIEV